MLAVKWAESALHDVDAIIDYLQMQGTPAKELEALLNRILFLPKSFAMLPGMGHRGKVKGTREWREEKILCTLIYIASPQSIYMLRVAHDVVKFPEQDFFPAVSGMFENFHNG